MAEILYKAFFIEPTTFQLGDCGRWVMQVHIRRDNGDVTRSVAFSTADTFDTEAEAIECSVNFAKRIIDGQDPHCSVNDLL